MDIRLKISDSARAYLAEAGFDSRSMEQDLSAGQYRQSWRTVLQKKFWREESEKAIR